VPCGWVATYFAPQAKFERLAHVQQGNHVRVVRGKEFVLGRVRQAVVVELLEHGTLLSLRDLETNKTVSQEYVASV
jgi:hypothetical protein